MSAATLIGVFMIPVFYVLMQGLSERLRGIPRRDAATPPAAPAASSPAPAAPP
jgi:hypothetical protein